MRKLSPMESVGIAELLTMETNSLAQARVLRMAVTDDQLRTLTDSGITATAARVRGLQQFLIENEAIEEAIH